MPTIYTKEQLGKDRVAGFYDTPIKTVEYMCRDVLAHYSAGKQIIDPAVGDGVFLDYLLRNGVRAVDLWGYDIDEEKVASLKSRFPNVSVFDATNPFPQRFDFVVGNPPYNGDESHFVRENRPRLEALAKEVGAKNTYSIISYQAIKSLRDGGLFRMILSDSFLTNVYYKPFREFLLRTLRLSELLLAPWKLFHGRSADVRTCIVSGSKKSDGEVFFDTLGEEAAIRLVDRVPDEESYVSPKHVELINQSEISAYPNSTFLIGVPSQMREIYLHAPRRLKDIVTGGTGISTGNDKLFLRRRAEVQNDPAWVPYYKNGARQPYWYEPELFIERDYRKHSDRHKTYMLRNEKYFFQEGVTCSSVGVRFSAAYLPEDSLFGVNANFFFSDRETLFYTLALLNSKLCWYFARRILIRSNNISANYLRLLPYQEPDAATKRDIASRTEAMVAALRSGQAPNVKDFSAWVDDLVYTTYSLPESSRNAVEDFCSNFYEAL